MLKSVVLLPLMLRKYFIQYATFSKVVKIRVKLINLHENFTNIEGETPDPPPQPNVLIQSLISLPNEIL